MLTLEGLTQVNPDGRVLPRLIERWEWDNGGLALRVVLRRNVRFHDGTSLTAPLAAAALEKILARPSNRALYPSLTDVIRVRPEGELQLVLELSQPSAFLPEDLSVPLQVDGDNVGTGPYRVASREGSQVRLEKFPGYYLGSPAISTVVLKSSDALRTTWTSLLRGEVDMMMEIPPNSVEFAENENVQAISFPHWYQFVLALNLTKPLFQSAAVRRALNVAVDRDALIKKALKGFGTQATGPIWPKHWAYDASIQGFAFDPAAATTLLDGAGVREGTAPGEGFPNARLRFTCLIPRNFSLLERLALELQRQFYDIGVDMQFEVVPITDYDTRIRDGKFEAVLVDMISGPTLGRPYIFWRSAKSYKGLNVFGYENSEAERSFDTLRTSMSEAGTRSATRRLQRALLDDPPAVFLAWNVRARIIRREFQIHQEPGRDPVQSLWRWTTTGANQVQAASLQ